MAMLASMSSIEPTAAGTRALLRNAAGVLFGVALGLLTLGASQATSRSALPELSTQALASPPAQLVAAAAPVEAAPDAPLRIRGRVGDGLYGSLLYAGLAPGDAAQFLKIVAKRINLARDVGPDDNFDLVLAPGIEGARQILYAAVERPGTSDVAMMRWSIDGRFDWLDTDAPAKEQASAMRPVAGRVTSPYGLRFHPILHFTRMHEGIDFAASAGTPITATSDGTVSRAGWAGGYGRQVRIDHGGGMVTSYSHMSGFAVAPGGHVRAGQVIGYVGSSGLSTGPHLHYEVFRNGVPVNPAVVRFGRKPPLAGRELARFQSQFEQIMTLAIQPPPRG